MGLQAFSSSLEAGVAGHPHLRQNPTMLPTFLTCDGWVLCGHPRQALILESYSSSAIGPSRTIDHCAAT